MNDTRVIELSGAEFDGLRLAVPCLPPVWIVARCARLSLAKLTTGDDILMADVVPIMRVTFRPTGRFTEDEEARVYAIEREL